MFYLTILHLSPSKLKENEIIKVVMKILITLIIKRELLDLFTTTNLIKNIKPIGSNQADCPYKKNIIALKYAPVIPNILVVSSSPTEKGDGSNSL